MSSHYYTLPKHLSYRFCMLSEQKFFKGKSDAYKYLICCIMQHMDFQVQVSVFNFQQILTEISLVIFDIVVKNKSNVV